MIKKWIEADECTGCAACANACPKHAIEMRADKYGYVHPRISESCINCGMCEKICKGRGAHNLNETRPAIYAAWSNDGDNRFTSTSGGFFAELAKRVIENGGIVFGAAYDENNLVEHIAVDSICKIESIKQSKYLQSRIGDTFSQAKKYLNNGRQVLFCGAPCQISGLLSFLGKNYDNLLTMDFICRGMNSPKAYESWIKEIERNNNKKIVKVWFKYKANGWKRSPRCTRFDFADGTSSVYDGEENHYMTAYLGPNLFIRPSCGRCDFKSFPRISDISVGDFWKIDESLDDDRGTSLVMINSKKGFDAFREIESGMKVFEQDFDAIFGGNYCIKNSVNINRKSKSFLRSLDRMDFSEAVRKYTKESLFGRIKRRCILTFRSDRGNGTK